MKKFGLSHFLSALALVFLLPPNTGAAGLMGGNGIIKNPAASSEVISGPGDLGHLSFYANPAAGVTKDGSNNISELVDSAGSRPFTSSGSNRPLWELDATVKNQPVVNNSGGEKFLTNDDAAIVSTNAAHTIVSIFRVDAPAFLHFFSLLKANTGEGLLTSFSSDGSFGNIHSGGGSFAYYNTGGVPSSMWANWLITYQFYNGSGAGTLSNYSLTADGQVATLSANGNLGAGNSKSFIGSWSTGSVGYNFQGKWAAIMKFDKVLNAEQITLLNIYIQDRWGITPSVMAERATDKWPVVVEIPRGLRPQSRARRSGFRSQASRARAAAQKRSPQRLRAG